jgi:hypothetical protein
MENDPDRLLDEDSSTIGDESDDVDVDSDDLGDEGDNANSQDALDPTKDIMDDDASDGSNPTSSPAPT